MVEENEFRYVEVNKAYVSPEGELIIEGIANPIGSTEDHYFQEIHFWDEKTQEVQRDWRCKESVKERKEKYSQPPYDLTPLEWDLFASDEGADEAAEAINKHLTKLVIEGQDQLEKEPLLSKAKLAEKIRDEMYEFMSSYVHLGARDTEPERTVVVVLRKTFDLDSFELSRW